MGNSITQKQMGVNGIKKRFLPSNPGASPSNVGEMEKVG
jgi:hypothetical protein